MQQDNQKLPAACKLSVLGSYQTIHAATLIETAISPGKCTLMHCELLALAGDDL
jgi:hypothetical protein